MEPLFVEEFGYLGDTDAALEVIKGTYVPLPPGMDPYLVELLDKCLLLFANWARWIVLSMPKKTSQP